MLTHALCEDARKLTAKFLDALTCRRFVARFGYSRRNYIAKNMNSEVQRVQRLQTNKYAIVKNNFPQQLWLGVTLGPAMNRAGWLKSRPCPDMSTSNIIFACDCIHVQPCAATFNRICSCLCSMVPRAFVRLSMSVVCFFFCMFS